MSFTKRTNIYGRPIIQLKQVTDFTHLIGRHLSDIILFDNGTDALLESGATILQRHYHIFIGTKDGELQYKPYEYDEHRIVVSTYKDIIVSVDSIG